MSSESGKQFLRKNQILFSDDVIIEIKNELENEDLEAFYYFTE